MVDKPQYENVHAFIEQGKKDATLVTGGYRYEGKGFYIPPTMFLNPKPDASIYKEEIFGPVVCVRTFETEEEALKMANDSCFGLAGMSYLLSVIRLTNT